MLYTITRHKATPVQKIIEMLRSRGHHTIDIITDDVSNEVFPFVTDVTNDDIVIADEKGKVTYSYEQLRDTIEEPVLTETRHAAFPIVHRDIYELYKNAVSSFWTSDEISMHEDREGFETLNVSEQKLVKHVLAFFSQADSIVMKNIQMNFLDDISLFESRMFLANQAFMEAEHGLTYSAMLDTLIDDNEERHKLINAIQNFESIRKKAEWAEKWMNKKNRFAERLLGFACVEGILFSSSFAVIFWVKTKASIPGLTLSNQFISRDENMHVEHAVLLYKKLVHKLDEETVKNIIGEAVETERVFIDDALPENVVGINKDLLLQYVQYVADTLANDLGYQSIYNATNPFSFMENLGLQGKTNFFEARASDYNKAKYIEESDDEDF